MSWIPVRLSRRVPLVEGFVCLSMLLWLSPLRSEDPSPSPAPSRSPAARPAPAPLNITIPLPQGETGYNLKIPQRVDGRLTSQLMMASVKRLDENHFRMERLVINLYKPDGQTDYKIDLPRCVYDLQTRIIHSDDPVSITTENFELKGDKMEFDTQARCGHLSGHVYMKIHDLKQAVEREQEPKTGK